MLKIRVLKFLQELSRKVLHRHEFAGSVQEIQEHSFRLSQHPKMWSSKTQLPGHFSFVILHRKSALNFLSSFSLKRDPDAQDPTPGCPDWKHFDGLFHTSVHPSCLAQWWTQNSQKNDGTQNINTWFGPPGDQTLVNGSQPCRVLESSEEF